MSVRDLVLSAAGVSGAQPLYVEDVFSTYLYTGNGSALTITNGIDLAGEGGMVWVKCRGTARNNLIGGPDLGTGKTLITNTTSAAITDANYWPAFYSDGFGVGADTTWNASGDTYASWTFRKQPKFFDVVTYTGNGSLPNQLISHNLGSVPGCIIIKATSAARDWIVWHRGNGTTNYAGLSLNLTSASAGSVSSGDLPTSTQFKPAAFFDPNYNNANETGVTYVAYLFAHDAGGFGDSGSDNVITCGSYTATGNDTINLGYEPQWILEKRVSGSGDDWEIADNMRRLSMTGFRVLAPNTSAAEVSYGGFRQPTATGYINTYWGSGTIIYIAIRRGPMKTPETGTEVYNATKTSSASGTVITTGITADLSIVKYLDGNDIPRWNDRLRGFANIVGNSAPLLASSNTNAELPGAAGAIASVWNTGFTITGTLGGSNTNYYSFRRAPGFFDTVCWTTTQSSGGTTNISHNLGVVPEMYIVKCRSGAGTSWFTYTSTNGRSQYLALNSNSAVTAFSNIFGSSGPTSTTFGIDEYNTVGNAGSTAVAYLFATLAGVSKVGSYTGTGTTQQINCGFTGGARFVMIKRADDTGDWYVWDTARGIGSGNDPYLRLNSNLAEVTTTDYIDTYSSGFQINSTAPADINANGGTFIFLAIA